MTPRPEVLATLGLEPPPPGAAELSPREALHLIVSLGDFQTRMARDEAPATILGTARLLLRRLLPFRAMSFLLVEEPGAEFVPQEADPPSSRASLQEAVDATVAAGHFAWALTQRRAVMLPAHRCDQTVVLHPLLTRSRVLGMFVGLFEGARPDVTDTLLSAFSAILFSAAQSLESAELYRSMRATMVSREELARANAVLRQEVVERQRAEAARRLSEERYRAVFDNAHDIIYTHDLEGRLTSINAAGERALGVGPGAGLGRGLVEFVVPEHVARARDLMARALRPEAVPVVQELEVLGTDGRRIPLEVSARAILREGVAVGVQGIARDLGERRRLEAQLLQAQKMEAVGRLAGGVAHDFNNLLTVMRGYCDLVLRRLGPDDATRDKVEQIRKAADSAAGLTRQLLAFSRQQVLQPRRVDLNAVVAGLDRMLRRLIGEDVELVTDLAADLGPVEADPGELEQVVMNLAVNARDAMPEGGRLTIRTRNAPGDPGADPAVVLAVSDSGSGMDGETASHIFEPFFTTKVKGQGTGLGLSTVYGIVQQHRGSIAVDTRPGGGTTFEIRLPRAAAAAPAPGERLPSPPGTPHGSETVLLVEDEAPVRELVRDILAGYGYRVVEAATGAEALAAAVREGPAVDLLLTDVVMPQMNGRTLARRLLADRPGLRVLYMSGYTTDIVGKHGVLEPGTHFLQKPFVPEALARKVREALA